MRTEDTALITRRVMFATEQCLLVLTHHPAVWHQAAQFLDQSSKALTDKGVRIVFSYPIYFQFQQFVLCVMTQQNQDIIIIKRLLIMKLDKPQILPIIGVLISLSINLETYESYLSIQIETQLIFYFTYHDYE